MKNLLYLISVLIFFGCNLSGKDNPESEKLHDTAMLVSVGLSKKEFTQYHHLVKNYFDSTLIQRGFSGQILVAKNGTILYQRSLGFADFRTQDSMTDNTPLHIASAGKTFTGMAVLHLWENNQLSLDDTLGKYFPAFPYKNITIKMLLSHRSGLPNYLNYLSLLKKNDTCYSNQDVLNSLYTLKPGLEYRSGTRFSYSNTNFVLLALIIEQVTGQSFPAYMKKMFFDPLEMTNTYVYNSGDPLNAPPSFEWNGKYWNPDPFDCTYGDKNLYTTANDLYKWDQALYSGLLFKESTLDSAFTPLSNERRSVHNYGLAWRMLNFPTGKKLIYHNGRWHGSNVCFDRFTDEKATIIVIGNKYNRNIYSSVRGAYNLFGEYVPEDDKDHDEENNSDSAATVQSKKVHSTPSNPRAAKTKR